MYEHVFCFKKTWFIENWFHVETKSANFYAKYVRHNVQCMYIMYPCLQSWHLFYIYVKNTSFLYTYMWRIQVGNLESCKLYLNWTEKWPELNSLWRVFPKIKEGSWGEKCKFQMKLDIPWRRVKINYLKISFRSRESNLTKSVNF